MQKLSTLFPRIMYITSPGPLTEILTKIIIDIP